jgi:molecular chaperone GrpE
VNEPRDTTEEERGGAVGQEDAPTADPESPDAAFEAAIAEANRRADENWDKYLRAEAELDNFRRVAQRRLEESVERQRRSMLEQFLEVADNLERALAHGDVEPQALVAGVEATYRELNRLLAREGVEAFDAMGEPFDPTRHEAMTVVYQPDVDTERVISVERPGYTLKGELLRPARVVVGKNTA